MTALGLCTLQNETWLYVSALTVYLARLRVGLSYHGCSLSNGERDLWIEMWLERKTGVWERRLIGSYLSEQPTADGCARTLIISDGRGVAILEPTSSGNAVFHPTCIINMVTWRNTSFLWINTLGLSVVYRSNWSK